MKYKAKKIGMTQIWENDIVVPITILKYEDETMEKEIEKGMKVKVRGISKGKGFQGVVKRHGFHGGPKSHGQKDRLRAPGSIGSTAPQRVIKGRKMAGHTGNRAITVRNLVVQAILPDAKTISVKGAVPGAKGGKVEIRASK